MELETGSKSTETNWRPSRPARSELEARKNQGVEWKELAPQGVSLLQAVFDFLTVLLVFWTSYFFYTGTLSRWSPHSKEEFLWISLSCSSIYLFIIERVGLFKHERSILNIRELRGIFYVGIVAAAVILSASFYLRFLDFSRLTMTTALVLSPIALYFQRQIFQYFHKRLFAKGFAPKKVLIFGVGLVGKHIAKRLFESPSLGLLPVGFLDDDVKFHGQELKIGSMGPRQGIPILGKDSLIHGCRKNGIDLVIIAVPGATFDRNLALVEACVKEGVEYYIVPNSYERYVQDVEQFEIGGIPLVRKRESKPRLVYLLNKRVMDFVLSLIFLILLSPFMLVIAALIKYDSKGPIIFKQKRVGYKGRLFSFYKFRSMHVDAPSFAVSPSDPTDKRITRVGRWLRRTSLDEIPQLFNVLRGDMSLVGPRPEMPFIVETYSPLQMKRLDAVPGVTGVWQISAVRGEPIHQNIEYDLFYIQNRSSLLDLAIIVKTVLSVMRGIGAV